MCWHQLTGSHSFDSGKQTHTHTHTHTHTLTLIWPYSLQGSLFSGHILGSKCRWGNENFWISSFELGRSKSIFLNSEWNWKCPCRDKPLCPVVEAAVTSLSLSTLPPDSSHKNSHFASASPPRRVRLFVVFWDSGVFWRVYFGSKHWTKSKTVCTCYWFTLKYVKMVVRGEKKKEGERETERGK